MRRVSGFKNPIQSHPRKIDRIASDFEAIIPLVDGDVSKRFISLQVFEPNPE
jgi:hypothetical protein